MAAASTRYTYAAAATDYATATLTFYIVVVDVPPAPSKPNVSSGNRSVALSWTSGGDGGSAITGWQYAFATSTGNTFGGFGVWTDVPNSGASTEKLHRWQPGKRHAPQVQGARREQRRQRHGVAGVGSGNADGDRSPRAVETYRVRRQPQRRAVLDCGRRWRLGHHKVAVRLQDYGRLWRLAGRSGQRREHDRLHFSGLTNGTAYTFRVRAVNSVGNGAASPESDSVTPATTPPAPSKPGVAPDDASVALSWTSGGDGGSAITRWQYAYKTTGGYGGWLDVPGSGANTTGYTVSGLTNGTAHAFKVRAVNAKGGGAESPESDSVTPATTPPAPSKPGVAPDVASVALSWTSGGDGGSAITRWQYAYKTTGGYGGWLDIPGSGANTTGYTVSGLTNGTAHAFKVRALNAKGGGAESPESESVTPMGPTPRPAPDSEPTVKPTPTRVPILSLPPTPTPTVTPRPTPTPTVTPRPTSTPTPTPTVTPRPTSTPTPAPTPRPTSTPTPAAHAEADQYAHARARRSRPPKRPAQRLC